VQRHVIIGAKTVFSGSAVMNNADYDGYRDTKSSELTDLHHLFPMSRLAIELRVGCVCEIELSLASRTANKI
jgi:hypothetical protein